MEKHEFKPKEWVLVRDTDEQNWRLGIYSHYDKDCGLFPYRCVADNYMQCIPYEGNEHLLGISKPADAPMETGGWKVGDKVEVEYDDDKKWYGGEIVRIDLSNRSWIDGEAMPYYVRSECFKWNDGCAWCAARQLRKPEEKPEEEFKFGDKVEASIDGEWCEAVVIEIDHSDIPYKVATPDGDVHWCAKSRVRRA